jgi:ATP-dependent DNA helicase PIF1
MFNLDNLMAVSSLSLKKGAQVMMIKNVDETLVNGSLGKVLGFMSESSYKLVQDDIAELPTQDLDLSIDDNGVDEVVKTEKKKAPSKESVSSMEDDVFGIPGEEEVDDDPLNVNWKRKRARLLMLQHNTKTLGTKYPLVRFYLTDGTTRDVLVQPETWTCQDLDGRDIASRTQVPLILAWALSIHKAQGQTLECVKVDLGSTFEKGQAYVAISRATTLSGLQIFRFSRDKVMVHKKVVEFYDSLTSFEDRDQYEPHLESAAPSVKYTRPQANMAQTADKPRMLDRDVYERSNGRKPMSELETNTFKSFSHAVTPPPFMQ